MSKEKKSPKKGQGVSRRDFLRLGTLTAAGAFMTRFNAAASAGASGSYQALGGIEEATIAELQAAMETGGLTSLALTTMYLSRITTLDQLGPNVNSILQVNPEATRIARALDKERRSQGPRGPLHGIPIVLKDNIDTADHMYTTAGSLALIGDPPALDSTCAERLRLAGAVMLAKTNLSEWANFRSFSSSSGWSGRGGQAKNPYVLDRNPSGSSSGSATAVAANLSAVALGTETDGSILSPANNNGVVGLKPTVGLTSRAGVIPISHTQDTVGVHARTVADAATVLGALTGVDPRDPATQRSEGRYFTDYTQFLDPNGLAGTRLGVTRNMYFTGYSVKTDEVFESALQDMAAAGATIVDPADFFNADQLLTDMAEFIVLFYEFKRDLNTYLETRTGVPVHSLADLIAFNIDHAEEEMKYFGQDIFEMAEADIFSEEEYLAAVERGPREAGPEGIDAVLSAYNLDAIVAPTNNPAWPIDLVNGDHFLGASMTPAAMAGYPVINVPSGYIFGLPVGISFMGTAFSEPTLIKLASGYENITHHRRPPEYLETLPLDGERQPHGRAGLYLPGSVAELSKSLREASRILRLTGR